MAALKQIGVLRKCDSLGRIVIPSSMRDYLEIDEGDKLEVFMTERGIFLKPHDEGEVSKVTPLRSDRISGVRL